MLSLGNIFLSSLTTVKPPSPESIMPILFLLPISIPPRHNKLHRHSYDPIKSIPVVHVLMILSCTTLTSVSTHERYYDPCQEDKHGLASCSRVRYLDFVT